MKKGLLNKLIHSGSVYILCLFLVASSIRVNIFAENQDVETGLCEHHPYHTEDCGYQLQTEEISCNHICNEDCYEMVVDCIFSNQEEQPIDEEKDDLFTTETSDHTCSEESGCIKQVKNCTHIHDENCGYQEAQDASECNYICDICNQPAEQVIAAWQWIDPEEILIWDEETSSWALGLPGADADHLLTTEILLEFLPKEINAEFSSETSEIIPISWDLSSFPEDGAFLGNFTLSAILPDGITLETNAKDLTVHLFLGEGSVYADPLLTESQLQSHIITDAVNEIDGVQVNLFDYWVLYENPTSGDNLTKAERHIRAVPSAWGNNSAYSTSVDWWKGINENHLLIFGDGIIHAGLWNKGAGEATEYGKKYAGMEGIVKPLLENGYPCINTERANWILNRSSEDDPSIDENSPSYRDYTLIGDYRLSGDHINSAPVSTSGGKPIYAYEGANIKNLSDTLIDLWEKGTNQQIETGTESLDYLFDPTVENPYKKTYQNILGLFQIDDDGYYYYNMRENFAEFKEENSVSKSGNSDGKFVLYDAPATQRSDGIADSIGNFFPFNKGTEVFNGIKADGTLSSSGIACSGNSMNHHLGMTVDVNFRQPINGMINMGETNGPMTFEFSGDDDVWIFIDDVLILDLGGVHSEIYGIIDFATGNVLIGQGFKVLGIPDYDSDHPELTEDLITMTNLRELYRAAGKEEEMNWNGNTFASSSDHSLKMFYLERGNYDSSLSLRFNLQPRLYQQIKKVDQNGNPINGIEFLLYEAEVIKKQGETSYKIKDETQPLTTLVTGKNALNEVLDKGTTVFEELDADGNYRPFNFADRYKDNGIQYYILKEQNTPDGYRPLPVDIVLEYNPNTTMLTVVNRYITGAYSSFTSTITGNSKITYGSFNTDTGAIEPSDITVNAQKQSEGLVVAIPMMWQENFGESGKWIALYGSNTSGLNASTPGERTPIAWRKAVLTAVLYQCSDENDSTPSWYLEWNNETKRLEGTLTDLPGRADRYQLTNLVDPDMKMVYMMIDPEVFSALNIHEASAKARYEALGAYVKNRLDHGDSIEEIVETIYQIKPNPTASQDSFDSRGVSFLNVDQFIRNFRSLIYIPNEQRELRIWKVNEDGKGINGATFSLFDNPDCTGTPVASGTTANVNGLDGTLIFAPYDHTIQGHAKMEWASSANVEYYLKETAAPEGYEVNPTIIPVVVGIYSIYADAGQENDGVSVMAGVGKLTQTMIKYAADENVNITLRDITAYAQKQDSNAFDLHGWEDVLLDGTQVERIMNLHYGQNAMIDYGLHDEDGGKNLYPFFVTDTGFIRARVTQNYDALKNQAELNGEKPVYGDTHGNDASKDKIDEDITSLFSLLNIVVITDKSTQKTATGQLSISKTVNGYDLSKEDYLHTFEFKVTLKDQNGKELKEPFYFYGTDKTGYLHSGEIIPLHHDESITIPGIPENTTYIIEELNSDGWFVLPENGKFTGQISSDKVAYANFINSNTEPTFEYGNLEIRKQVEGDQGDLEREFTFNIFLTDEEGREFSTTLSYIGDKQGQIYSGEAITLKHGQSITLLGIPANIHYTVTEKEANQDGYVTSSTNASGIITKDETITASFVNKKGIVPITDEENGSDSNKNGGKNPANTGDPSSNTAAFIFFLSALCLISLAKKKTKKI